MYGFLVYQKPTAECNVALSRENSISQIIKLLSTVFLYVMIGIHDVPGWGGYEVHCHLAGPEEARGGDSKIPRLVT